MKPLDALPPLWIVPLTTTRFEMLVVVGRLVLPIVKVPLLIVTVLFPKCLPVFKTVILPAFRIVCPEKVLAVLKILKPDAPFLMSVPFVPAINPPIVPDVMVSA